MLSYYCDFHVTMIIENTQITNRDTGYFHAIIRMRYLFIYAIKRGMKPLGYGNNIDNFSFCCQVCP